MKVWFFYLAFLLFAIVFIPYIASNNIQYETNKDNTTEINLYNHITNKTQKISLEDYITSVVCAEMPAEFSKEALKAQSVAARTYALRKILYDKNSHSDGDLCTDYAHCQAYASAEELKEKWGSSYSEYIDKIRNAVNETAGEYLAYNNEPAIAVFHSCSNGITESSSDVWGGDIPYLVSVNSEGDLDNKDYVSSVKFSYDEFVRILKTHIESIDLSAVPVSDFRYSTGGNVLSVNLFGVSVSGTDIRKLYSLKSTSFDIKNNSNEFVFTVYGSGHGVGMSQYGANNMAKNGSDYRDILLHYYPGTNIANMNN